jgi:16S rRNA pseudouridine516 synthase
MRLDRSFTKCPTIRVDKLLSSLGYGSRNEVARLVRAGQVMLDGVVLDDATKRIPFSKDLPARMVIDGAELDPITGHVILMNKPLGMICSHKENGPLVHHLLPERWRRRKPAISTIGRLDKNTSGLLLLTDDGDLLQRIINPRRHIEKAYRVCLARPITGEEAALFASGSMLLENDPKPLAPAKLDVFSTTEVKLTITEGRYHQVRRMFSATGNHVESLHRESLGRLTLPTDLVPGAWKELDDEEIALVFQ